MSDGELDRLNDEYRREGLVFVRKRKIGVYLRGTDGEPTGDALMRFENVGGCGRVDMESHPPRAGRAARRLTPSGPAGRCKSGGLGSSGGLRCAEVTRFRPVSLSNYRL